MRIRSKLLLGSAVPVVILLIQVLVVNYFIRQLQAATTIIGDAHTVIEADFAATDLVTALKQEVKKLPSAYDDTSRSNEQKLESYADLLSSEIDTILAYRLTDLEVGSAFTKVDGAYQRVSSELQNASQVAKDPDSDLDTLIQKAILSSNALKALERALATLAIELRVQLQNAVDIERSVRDRPALAGLLLGAFALIVSVLLTYLIVDRGISKRLRQLSDSMLAIAGGKLATPVTDLQSSDEISAMSRALSSFRDTAVEVEENNLRQIAVARQRLIDALESIADGFAFYSQDGSLELSNRQYGNYLGMKNQPAAGQTYDSLVRDGVERGDLEAQGQSNDEVVARLVKNHREPAEPLIQQLSNGRWVRISDRLTSSGSRVSLFTDITELKDTELQLRHSTGQLLDSIHYASRIQKAVLPDPALLSLWNKESFLIWQPRDLVGGDFYWFHPMPNGYMIFLGDCTGHGVPGAFMTLISGIILERLVLDNDGALHSPAKLLESLDTSICRVLSSSVTDGAVNDGLEAGVCFIDLVNQQLVFSGARFSLWTCNEGEILETKGVRRTLGASSKKRTVQYSDSIIPLSQVRRAYMTTDGLLDQVGGSKRLAFGKRRFRTFLKQSQHMTLSEQADSLLERFQNYQGGEARRDDVSVIGFDPSNETEVSAQTR